MDDRDWFTCECGCHAYQVERVDWDNEWYRVVSISLWNRGATYYRWRDRLRDIWAIIRHGHPNLEEVLLTPDEAASFARVIHTIAMGANDVSNT